MVRKTFDITGIVQGVGFRPAIFNLATAAGAPVLPASEPLPKDEAAIMDEARAIGLPVMLKASWGGGGRGMRVIENESDIFDQVSAARREAKAAFGNDEVYFEKLVRRAQHRPVGDVEQ